MQLSIFAAEKPQLDASFTKAQRHELGLGAWCEYVPGWLSGHERVFAVLRDSIRFRQEERLMYERWVLVPRLYATLPEDGPIPGILEQASELLDSRYQERFTKLSLGYYRDGKDSVAWHGDQIARKLPSSVMATISVGAPRAFYLRPKGGGDRFELRLGWGDLLVMGGTCQRTWEHSVPKTKSASPRLAIMYRPDWREPEPP
jgi:hypothetical protein